MNTLGQLSIENGRKFENLLQVVDHYSRTPDGLLCSLGDVCPVELFEEHGMMPTQAKVNHGPRRIDDRELVVQGELGELLRVHVPVGTYVHGHVPMQRLDCVLLRH